MAIATETQAIERDKTTTEAGQILGMSSDKIVRLILAGELEGYNAAENPNGQRPRWKVTMEAIRQFRARRAAVPPPAPVRRRSKHSDINAGNFY